MYTVYRPLTHIHFFQTHVRLFLASTTQSKEKIYVSTTQTMICVLERALSTCALSHTCISTLCCVVDTCISSVRVLSLTHTQAHTHKHTHTSTHTQAHTHKHTHTSTHTQAHTHKRTHTSTRTQARTHKRAHTHTHTNPTHTCVRK